MVESGKEGFFYVQRGMGGNLIGRFRHFLGVGEAAALPQLPPFGKKIEVFFKYPLENKERRLPCLPFPDEEIVLAVINPKIWTLRMVDRMEGMVIVDKKDFPILEDLS